MIENMKHLDPLHYDLTTPDGALYSITSLSDTVSEAMLIIEKISSHFIGFQIPQEYVEFNIKSTLAQVGINGKMLNITLDPSKQRAEIHLVLESFGAIGNAMLPLLTPGAIIGKLFAADPRRRVRDPAYLLRMFGRSDRWGRPLLSLGGMHGSNDLLLEKIDGRTVAFLGLKNGQIKYEETIYGFLPTLAKALHKNLPMRQVLPLHQSIEEEKSHTIKTGELLLVKTLPLHIRTVFGRVVNELLPQGCMHTSANVLQPDTQASGDIYELIGSNQHELSDIPLEFYTLEPYREHVFFEDRDQLQGVLEDETYLLRAAETFPKDPEKKAAAFIVKGKHLMGMTPEDWTVRTPRLHELPGIQQGNRQGIVIERYIEQQPIFPFLKAIDDGVITSQGVLLCRYFPSPFMKRFLLGEQTHRLLKGLYFYYPSQSHEGFFSAEDRALLHDLYHFGIPTFWVDQKSQQVLQYLQKRYRDSGIFVPVSKVETYLKSTMFGIYGSNLIEREFEDQLTEILSGILEFKETSTHPLLNSNTPIAMVTGGGPGAMEVGNRVAKALQILSCANIIDFRGKNRDMVVNEQQQNSFIDAKMTYRLDKLVERQAEFNLDFPIFLTGGIGTDFELALEEVRRKVGAVALTPIILMGTENYWEDKITARFKSNLKHGTIKGSEWVSNCFYVAKNAKEALIIYKKYFEGTLSIGKDGPIFEKGFGTVNSWTT